MSNLTDRKILRQIRKECLCDQCICMPMCRHKSWIPLVNDCSLLQNYLYNDGNAFSSAHRKEFFKYRIQSVFDILNPAMWGLSSLLGSIERS